MLAAEALALRSLKRQAGVPAASVTVRPLMEKPQQLALHEAFSRVRGLPLLSLTAAISTPFGYQGRGAWRTEIRKAPKWFIAFSSFFTGTAMRAATVPSTVFSSTISSLVFHCL